MLQPMRLQRAGQDLVTEQQLGFTVCIFSHSILSSNNYSTSSIMQNLSLIYFHVPHAFLCSTVVLELSKLWALVTDRETRHAAVHGVTKNGIQLRD